jgi:hypothetical protein
MEHERGAMYPERFAEMVAAGTMQRGISVLIR